MKVMVGVDGTEKSLQAIRLVTHILAADRDQLTLFFAAPPRSWSEYFSVSREDQAAMLAAFADDVFQQALGQVPVGFSTMTLRGEGEQKPARALLDAAEQSDSDLIVVGAGRSSHRLPFSIGGVARSVLHESQRPVLACRQSHRAIPGAPFKVLLAADPADPMDSTVNVLRQFTWPSSTLGRIIHVMDYVEDERLRHWINQSANLASSAWNAALDQEVEEERDRIRQQLAQLQARLPSEFQEGEPILTVGHIVEQIVETVEREAIDLVVVGGRRLGPVSRLLGSTTEGLLLQANASILVVHTPSVS